MAEFANYHFATEEKYFDLFDYENSTEYKSEHLRFKEKIAAMINDVGTDKLKQAFDAIDFLEDWLISHLSSMDKDYVKCFKEHGLK